ncbi:MAG: endodeoxyribonuclease RusA [Alphaproteobacteria bacterium]|nr:endodeoxyribonuclease RusA [Alphaproteobacteria bacterium]
MKIELPYPPSVLNPNRKAHWAVKHKAQKKYKSDCMWSLKGTKPMKEFRVNFFPPTSHRRDQDNAIAAFKYGIDAMAAEWGIDDSEFIIHFAPQFGAPVKGGKVVISE